MEYLTINLKKLIQLRIGFGIGAAILFFFFVFSSAAFSQTWQWGRQAEFSSPPNSTSMEGYSICADSHGNAYLAGSMSFDDTVYFGNYQFLPSAKSRIFLVKYDPNGNVLWARESARNIGNSFPVYSCATDTSDDVYLAGNFQDSISLGTDTLTFNPGPHGFIAKYKSDGTFDWAKLIDNSSYLIYGIASDRSGYLYATGEYPFFLTKYDLDGNIQWEHKAASGFGSSVAIDGLGEICVAGSFSNATFTLGSFTLNKISSGFQSDLFLAKYDKNGNVLWLKDVGDSCNAFPIAAADVSGNVYISDNFWGKSETFGSNTYTNTGVWGVFLAKYDPSGALLWSRGSNGNQFDFTGGLACDKEKNVYWTGGFDLNISFNVNNDPFTIDSHLFAARDSMSDPAFIVKFDSAGNILCSSVLSSGGDDYLSIACGPSGSAYIGGDFEAWYKTQGGIYGATALSLGPDTLKQNTTNVLHGVEIAFIGRYSCSCNPMAVSPNAYICQGSSVTLTAEGGSSYTWSPSIDLSGVTGPSVTASPTITTVYTVADSSEQNCPVNLKVTVLNSPAMMVSANGTICFGNSLVLSASGVNRYTWASSSGLSSVTGSTVSASPAATTTYTITGSNGQCDRNSVITITVNQLPVPLINVGEDVSIIVGSSIQLIATGGTYYTWSPSSTLSCNTCSDPYANPAYTTKYYVTVTSAEGCSVTDSVIVFVERGCGNGGVFVPNTFTPNGDGLNDVFALSVNTCIRTMNFIIYNRWGNKLFESNASGAGWDGTYKGRLVEEDVYIWKANTRDYTDQNHEYTGRITILR